MRTLPPPTADERAVFDDVRGRRRPAQTRVRLAVLRPEVFASYDTYDARGADSLVTLTPLAVAPGDADILKSNFEALAREEQGLYSELRLSAAICPMCGERDVTTLDHVLPRSVFPEFAVLPANLVPACSECNRRKRSYYRDASGGAIFVHAYRDDLRSGRFLAASIDTSSGVALVDYSIVYCQDLPAGLNARLPRHFDKLGLAELYKLNGELDANERAFEVSEMLAAGLGPADVAHALTRQARAAVERRGPNHWRAVLLQALAADEHFVAGMP